MEDQCCNTTEAAIFPMPAVFFTDSVRLLPDPVRLLLDELRRRFSSCTPQSPGPQACWGFLTPFTGTATTTNTTPAAVEHLLCPTTQLEACRSSRHQHHRRRSPPGARKGRFSKWAQHNCCDTHFLLHTPPVGCRTAADLPFMKQSHCTPNLRPPQPILEVTVVGAKANYIDTTVTLQSSFITHLSLINLMSSLSHHHTLLQISLQNWVNGH